MVKSDANGEPNGATLMEYQKKVA